MRPSTEAADFVMQADVACGFRNMSICLTHKESSYFLVQVYLGNSKPSSTSEKVHGFHHSVSDGLGAEEQLYVPSYVVWRAEDRVDLKNRITDNGVSES